MNDFKNKGAFGGGRPSFGGGRGNDRGGFSGPRKEFGGRPSFGGGRGNDRGGFGGGRPMELHQAICADCGKSCEVPFKPNGRKPVYCKDCFARNEGGGESGSRPARDFNLTPKPFVKSPSPLGGDKRIDDMKVQLDSVNYKLEKLIKMLEASKAEAPKAAVVAPAKAEAAKVVAKTEAPVAKTAIKVVAPAKAVKPAAKKAAPKKK